MTATTSGRECGGGVVITGVVFNGVGSSIGWTLISTVAIERKNGAARAPF